MTSVVDLMHELLAERYGPRPLRDVPRLANSFVSDGGPDTDIAIARRRRVLCEAPDEDMSQDFRRGWRSVA